LRLRQLACFVRVCELGSITRAAAEMHIAQPALGLQIRSLEDEFGAELFVRSSRGVSTTAAGEIVLRWAREALEGMTKTRDAVKELEQVDNIPFVTVGLTASMTILLAAKLVAAVRGKNIKLKIVEGLSQSMADWVDSGRVHIGLGFDVEEARAVKITPILKERLFYLSSPGSGEGPISLTDVLRQPLALPDEQNSIRHVIEAAAHTIDMPVVGSYEVGSLQATRQVAMTGIAGAVVPFGGVAGDRLSGDLSVRLITDPPVERTLYLVQSAYVRLSASERELAEIVLGVIWDVMGQEAFAEAYTLISEAKNLAF